MYGKGYGHRLLRIEEKWNLKYWFKICIVKGQSDIVNTSCLGYRVCLNLFWVHLMIRLVFGMMVAKMYEKG